MTKPTKPTKLRDDLLLWNDTPIDLSEKLLPQEAFQRIYAPGTRQNRAGKPGLYRFYLAHRWSTTLLDDGPYQLEVEAIDLCGNSGRLQLPIMIANNI